MTSLPRGYAAWGILVLSLYVLAAFRGWSFTSVSESRDLPKTVRDNPGAYRSHYVGHTHYFGGK